MTGSLMQSIFLMLWFVVVLFFIAATIVSGIVALATKDKARRIAVDCALGFGTVVISSSAIPAIFPQMVHQGAKDAFQLPTHNKAEIIGRALIQKSYILEMPAPFRALLVSSESDDLKRALQSADESIAKLREKHKFDPYLAARQAIVKYEKGQKTEALELLKPFSPDSDPDDVDEVITPQNTNSLSNAAILHRLYSDDAKDLPTRKELEENFTGWYRNATVIELSERKGDTVLAEQIKTEQRAKASLWNNKYIAYILAQVILSLTGIAALVIHFLRRPKTKLPDPLSFGFRKSYGCLLVNIFSQNIVGLVVGLAVGFYSGMQAAINHTKPEIPNVASIIAPIAIVVGTLATFSCFYLVALRPAGLSIKQALTKDNLLKNLKEVILVAIGGFSAMVFISMVTRLLFIKSISANNNTSENMLQYMDSLSSQNIPGIVWSIAFFCLFAPFVEELLCRVLLFTWLRNRFNIATGVIVSSLVFALLHLNLPLLPVYFVIGCVLAAVYERTRSYPAIVAIHGLWNLWVSFAVAALLNV